MAVVRLNSPQGTLDTSYGVGTAGSRVDFGALVPNATGPATTSPPRSRCSPTGRSCSPVRRDAAGTDDMAVVRLNNRQGTFDTSYGGGTGGSRVDFGGARPERDVGDATTLARSPYSGTGRSCSRDTATPPATATSRWSGCSTPQGTLDSSYGLGTGGSRVDVGATVAAARARTTPRRSTAVQPDGKILVCREHPRSQRPGRRGGAAALAPGHARPVVRRRRPRRRCHRPRR